MKYVLKVMLTREVEVADSASPSEQHRIMEMRNEELVSPFESEGWDVDITSVGAMEYLEEDDEEDSDEE